MAKRKNKKETSTKLLNLLLLLLLPFLLTACPGRDKTYVTAEEQYLAAWILHNPGPDTEKNITYNESQFMIINYTFDYPSLALELNDILFWFAPEVSGLGGATPLKHFPPPLNRIYYVYSDDPPNDQYQHPARIIHDVSFTSLDEWSPDMDSLPWVSMDQNYLDWELYIEPGVSKIIHFGQAPFLLPRFYLRSSYFNFENPLLRGNDGQTFFVAWAPDSEKEIDPELTFYRNGELFEYHELTRWDEWKYPPSVYLQPGDYYMNLTIPTYFDIWSNITLEAWFNYTQGQEIIFPELLELDFPSNFVPGEDIIVDIKLNHEQPLENIELFYSTNNEASWNSAYENSTQILLPNQAYTFIINDTNTAESINAKLNITFADGEVAYTILPISRSALHVTLNLIADSNVAAPGQTLNVSGQCVDAQGNNCSGVRLIHYVNDKKLFFDGADEKSVFRYDLFIPPDYNSSTINLTTIFEGTGRYKSVVESLTLPTQYFDHDIGVRILDVQSALAQQTANLTYEIFNSGNYPESDINIKIAVDQLNWWGYHIDETIRLTEVIDVINPKESIIVSKLLKVKPNWNYFEVKITNQDEFMPNNLDSTIKSITLLGANPAIHTIHTGSRIVNLTQEIGIEIRNYGILSAKNLTLSSYILHPISWDYICKNEPTQMDFEGEQYQISVSEAGSRKLNLTITYDSIIETFEASTDKIKILQNGIAITTPYIRDDCIEIYLGVIDQSEFAVIDKVDPGIWHIHNYQWMPTELETYLITAKVNHSDDIDYSDNFRYIHFYPILGGPDITTWIEWSWSSPVTVNETINIIGWVRNDGTERALDVNISLYEITQYYDEDTEQWIDQYNIISEQHIGDLVTGASASANFTFTPTEPREYKLALVANAIEDINLDNNEHIVRITVYSNAPDVRAYMPWPDDGIVGQEKIIETTVYSEGLLNATNVNATLYQYEWYWNGTHNVENLTLINSTIIGFIETGQSKDVNFAFIPTEDKWYNLKFIVNAPNDSNPDNNIYYDGFRARVNAPDVRAYIPFQGDAIVNETKTIATSIYNDGALNATNFTVTLYEDYWNGTDWNGLTIIDSEFITILEPGNSLEINFNWIPLLQTDYSLKLAAEVDNDANLDNNNYTRHIYPRPRGADLYGYIHWFDSAIINESISVNYTVSNWGTEDALNSSVEIIQLTNRERYYNTYETREIYYQDYSIFLIPSYISANQALINLTVNGTNYPVYAEEYNVYHIQDNLGIWMRYINEFELSFYLVNYKNLTQDYLGTVPIDAPIDGSFSWTPDTAGTNYLFIKVDADNEVLPQNNHDYTYVTVNYPGPNLVGSILSLPFRNVINQTVELQVDMENIGTEIAQQNIINIYDFETFEYLSLNRDDTLIIFLNNTLYEIKLITLNKPYIEINFVYDGINENITFDNNRIASLQNNNTVFINRIYDDFIYFTLGQARIYTSNVQDLSPRENLREAIEWTPTVLGDHRIVLELQTAIDTNWDNNYWVAFALVVGDGPDLSVFVTDIWDIIFVVNTKHNITVFINNLGTKAAENINLTLYDVTYDEENIILEPLNSTIIDSLAADETTNVIIPYTPTQVAFKDFKVEATIENDVYLNNNHDYFGKYIHPEQPDLKVRLYVDEIAIVNEPQRIRGYAENWGAQPAYNVNVTLSQNDLVIDSTFVEILENIYEGNRIRYFIDWTPASTGTYIFNLTATSQSQDYNISDNSQTRQTIVVNKRNATFTITNSNGNPIARDINALGSRANIDGNATIEVPNIIGPVDIYQKEPDSYFFIRYINSSLNNDNNITSEIYYNIQDGLQELIAIHANKISWQYANKTESGMWIEGAPLDLVQNLTELILLSCSNWDFNNKACINQWQNADVTYKDTFLNGIKEIQIIGIANYSEAFAITKPMLLCGNNICDETETIETCPADCFDDDHDGINNTVDNLIGNESYIETNIENISVEIDNSTELNQVFNETRKVEIIGENKTIVEFDFNFTNNTLDLTNLSIIKQDNVSGHGHLIVAGLDLEDQNKTKTVFVDKISNSNKVCIKDAEIASIIEITSSCSGANETKMQCKGKPVDGYTCTVIDNSYKVEGLKHSGIREEVAEDKKTLKEPGKGPGVKGAFKKIAETIQNTASQIFQESETVTEKEILVKEQEQIEEEIPKQSPKKSNLLKIILTIAAITALIFLTAFSVRNLRLSPEEKVLKPIRKYIRETRKKGFSDQDIRKALLNAGWPKKNIDKVLKSENRKVNNQ